MGGGTKTVEAKIPNATAEEEALYKLVNSYDQLSSQQGIDITRIQQLLNHSSPSITLRYIGITRQELDQVYINLNL